MSAVATVANAQVGGSWGYDTGTGQQGNTYGGYTTPPVIAPPPNASSGARSDEEIAVLYGTSAGLGATIGLWFDAEAGIKDPGLQFIAPVVLGLAAPVGVYFLDYPPLPKGMPAAISAGIFLGIGEGINIWSYQFASANQDDAWRFKGASRAMAIGGTLGAGAGFALGYYQEPSPKSSFLIGSAAVWGSIVGSMVGYGASNADYDFDRANDSGALGSLIGYNVGMAAAGGLSALYVPAWDSIGWMWAGAGIGAAAGIPLYLVYAGSDSPAKRGLILHGVAVTLGIAAGGIFSSHLTDTFASDSTDTRPKLAEITNLGLMTVDGGMGVQLMGTLF